MLHAKSLVAQDPSSDAMKAKLDTIDNVRTVLSGLKGPADQLFYEELLGSLPQFVACGPQSAGKSSVIRRISGVALPEASTLCTRIATMVQMRRASDSSISVSLNGPGGEIVSNELFDDSRDVQAAIKQAQQTALARQKGQNTEFVEDHTIQVRVCGPYIQNVTLVDLPGFHTANDNDTKTVNAMVQRYVEMPGTLALHVIKGDQDYGSMLGNDFMRQVPKQDTPRVTVLTHCDKLDHASIEDAERLRTTLDTTTVNSSLTVAVHGRAGEEEQEVDKLGHLAGMDSRLDIGTPLLAKHLEARMCEHLETQYPKAIAKLQASLVDCNTRLDIVQEQAPADVLHHMVYMMRENFVQGKQNLMNELREDLSKMTLNIKNFGLAPLMSTGDHDVKAIDKFDEPLENGQRVWVKIDDLNSAVIVTTVNSNHITWQETLKESGAEPKVGSTPLINVGSGETKSANVMTGDIVALAANRGMRNFVHMDRQPIIECYAKAFAQHYTKEIRDTKDLICKKLDLLLNTVFSKNLPEIAKLAAAKLQLFMHKGVKESLEDCENAIIVMESQNTEPDLIFSPNEHYLNDLIQEMVAADQQMATDQGGTRLIFHNVRAYIKVQRKQISEQASKELIRTMVLGTQRRFNELLSSRLSEYEKYVSEPSKVMSFFPLHARTNTFSEV